MVTKKTPKNAIQFHCEKCNFTCIKNSDWCRHLTTATHKKITNGNDFTPKKNLTYICEHCDKEFKYASSLSRQSKKCSQKQEPIEDTTIKNNTTPPKQPDSKVFINLLNKNQK